MREPRILSETEVKEIEELLHDDNLRVNWRDGVLEDYYYTKEILSAKEHEAAKKENKKEKKKKYCSICGTLIDTQTKKCTGCGKQYANKNTISHCITVGVLLAICLYLAVTTIYFYGKCDYWYCMYQSEQTTHNEQYTPLFEDYTSLLTNKKIVGMYNVEVVNVSDNKRYHVVGSNCWEQDGYDNAETNSGKLAQHLREKASTKIWTAEYANEQGYHPCPKCFK